MSPQPIRLAQRINLRLSLLPAVALLWQLFYALQVRLTLGRWPVAHIDQVSGRFWAFTDTVAVLLGTAVVLSPLVWLPAFWFVVRAGHIRTILRNATLYFGFYALLFIATISDNSGFTDWFLD